MPEPTGSDDLTKPFLDVRDAERVHGPDVIADKVSGALKDADRFGLPHVKPPLSEALNKVKSTGTPAEAATAEGPDQNAMTGVPVEVDEKAGSAEVLQPAERAP